MRHFIKLCSILSVLALSSVASATSTDGTITWRIWGYVHQFRVQPSGDLLVIFKDSNGNVIKNWPDSTGTDICGGSQSLYVAKAHAGYSELSRLLQTAGVAKKSVKIGYQAVSGTCWVKEILAEM